VVITKATFLFFVLLLYPPPGLSQSIDNRRFLPYAVGNTWRWHSATGSDFDRQITRDPVDVQGAHHIFYNYELNPTYIVDTPDDVYRYVTETSRYLWFRLSAEQGNSFYTWNGSFKVVVEVGLDAIHSVIPQLSQLSRSSPGTRQVLRTQLLASSLPKISV
jgi:hypothetical protein